MKIWKILPILFLILSVILTLVCLFVLPDPVVIQFTAGGEGVTTAPKLLGLLIPAGLGIGGAVVTLLNKEDVQRKGRALFVSGIGLVVFVLMLVVNLMRG